jgi:hypothetical protein
MKVWISCIYLLWRLGLDVANLVDACATIITCERVLIALPPPSEGEGVSLLGVSHRRAFQRRVSDRVCNSGTCIS